MQIRPGKTVLFHSRNHVRKVVLCIRVLAVCIDPDKCHSAALEPIGGLTCDLIRTGYERAVIAGKENNQERGVRKVAQCIVSSIGRWKIEFRSARSDWQCKRHPCSQN